MKIAIVGSSKIPHELTGDVIMKVSWVLNEEDILISGGADGVDSLSEAYADVNSIKTMICLPDTLKWEGYKKRNMLIAERCDKLYNIVIGNKDEYCYHHKTKGHYKSGGCWTQLYAKSLGKIAKVIEV